MLSRLKLFIHGLITDETGSPSSTKLQQWGSWFIVTGTFIWDTIQHGLHNVELALGLLGLGAVSRGMSSYNNFKYRSISESNQPKRSLFSNTDNGEGPLGR